MGDFRVLDGFGYPGLMGFLGLVAIPIRAAMAWTLEDFSSQPCEFAHFKDLGPLCFFARCASCRAWTPFFGQPYL